MRFTIREPVGRVLHDCVGRNIPLRIGPLAWTAILESVEYVDGEAVLTFDISDAEMCWEALIARRNART